MKHTSNPMTQSSVPTTFSEPSGDPKSRKRKKVTSSVLPNPMTQSSVPTTFSEPSGDPKSRKRKKVTSSVLPTSQPAQNVEKVVIPEETLTKVEESKIQAEEANQHAVNAASQCHGVWSQLERQYNCGLNSDDEAKLVSSAVSIAAAASVAKVAAAAAKIASDVADQASSMATVYLSNKSQTADQSGLVNRFDKATTDAILKAAEMAAEAVSQAGKIVAMSEPVPLRDLIEAGPEGYWKTPQSASKQQALVAGNLNWKPVPHPVYGQKKKMIVTEQNNSSVIGKLMDWKPVPHPVYGQKKVFSEKYLQKSALREAHVRDGPGRIRHTSQPNFHKQMIEWTIHGMDNSRPNWKIIVSKK